MYMEGLQILFILLKYNKDQTGGTFQLKRAEVYMFEPEKDSNNLQG